MSAFNGTCCDALIAIAKVCAEHALGVAPHIDIIEACDILSIPAVDVSTHTISGDIVLDTGKQWYQWKIGGSAEFNYNSIGTSGNATLENILTTFLPLQRDQNEMTINAILNGEFVIRFSDINGASRILGTASSPVMIPDGGIQGVISAESNGTTVTFRNVGHTPYFYTGAVSYVPAV